MSKAATIASLVRIAAKTEPEFVSTVEQVLEEGDTERMAEFFDRLNIPRSVGLDQTDPTSDVPHIKVPPASIGNFQEEREISNGIQKFLDRHERKMKWHAGHPSIEGSANALLLFRAAIAITELRLERLHLLMATKEELTPEEWAISRELMNRAYLTYRNYLNQLAADWIDAMQSTVSRDELADVLGSFYEVVDQAVRSLEGHRERIEERRQQLAVLPDGFPPVKPPAYFGGDLLGRGPWKQFWAQVVNRAHHFRESAI